jgi:M6 family metalloprotease-like protein
MSTRVSRWIVGVALAAASLLAVWVVPLRALEPPRPEDVERYRQEGTLDARVKAALALRNNEVAPALARRLAGRLQALSFNQNGVAVIDPAATDLALTDSAQTDSTAMLGAKVSGSRLPTKGQIKILVLLLEFQNYSLVHDPAHIESMLFGDGVGSPSRFGTLRSFYLRESYGQLGISGNILRYRTNADRPPEPTDPEKIKTLPEDLIKEALRYYEIAGHDFSQYDNDNDGVIDYVAVIWTGPSSGWGQIWWGQNFPYVYDTSFTVSGKRLGDHSWQAETGWNAPAPEPPEEPFFSPGTLCHETGHALGLPDYYDYKTTLTVGPPGGVGPLDLMGDGGITLSAFSKFLLGWIAPTAFGDGNHWIILRQLYNYPDAALFTRGAVSSSPFREFFMVESTIFGGVAVWHVDARVAPDGNFLFNNQNTSHKLLRFMEADGQEDFERGGSGLHMEDLYQANDAFGPATFPSSVLYSGTPSYMGIRRLQPRSAGAYRFEVFTSDDLTPPEGVPAVPVPDTAYSQVPRVTFRWGPGNVLDPESGITGYQLQIADANGYVYADEWVPASPQDFTWFECRDGYSYRARVRAQSGGGAYTQWSDWGPSVLVDSTPPSGQPSAPTDEGAYSPDGTLAFRWDAGTARDPHTGIASFRLEIVRDSSGGDVVDATNVAADQELRYVFSSAQDGVRYFARARAFNKTGLASAWSEPSDGILVDTTGPTGQPSTPQGPGPVVTDDFIPFSWTQGSADDPESGIAAYEIQAGTTSGTPNISAGNIVSASGALNWTLANLDDERTYYAQVRALNGAGLATLWSSWSNGVQVVLPPFETCEALDNCALAYKTSGDLPWQAVSDPTYFNGSAAQSGAIGASERSYLQTKVTGPGTLRFLWRVSSAANQDHLRFYKDKQELTKVSGEVGWQQRALYLPVGEHTLRWSYTRGAGAAAGANAAWLDNVQYPAGPMELSINDVTLLEGDQGTKNATFAVTLTPASVQVVKVDYRTMAGTATAGVDYETVSGTLTFLPGETAKTIAVPVTGDTEVEADETFLVELSNALPGPDAIAVVRHGTGTIRSDDIGITIDDTTVDEAVGNSAAVFKVHLTAASTQTVTVDYATPDAPAATAKPGDDYRATNGALTFAPGETSKEISVLVYDDTVYEGNEAFFVHLNNAVNATIVPDNRGVATIRDNEPEPRLSINDVTVTEGFPNTSTTAVFAITLSVSCAQTVTVVADTADGTATAGSDYTAKTGKLLTFAPGETTQTVSVVVAGDSEFEADETFFVNLSSAVGAAPGRAQGVGTIANDDVPTIDVVWTNLVGVSATGNSLVKTAAASAWDAGASSAQAISSAGGFAEFTAQETTTGRVFGLNHEDLSATDADIDFGLRAGNTGNVYVMESGTQRGTFGTYVSGDRFRVAVESGVVKYYRNGAPLYTSTVAPTFPLHVDTSIKHPGGTIQDAVLFALPGPPGPPVAVISAPASARTGVSVTFDGSGSWDPDGSIVSYGWVFDDGTTATGPTATRTFATMGRHSATLTVTDNSGNASVPPATQAIDIIAPVVWTNPVGVSASGNSLAKTAATAAWDAGASSAQAIPSTGGFAEFTAQETTTGRVFGLNHVDLSPTDVDIDYGLWVGNTGNVYVMESGTQRGTFGTYVSGDRFRVAVESGVVKYYRNGTPLYTSTVAPTFPLRVDTSIKHPGGTIQDAVLFALPGPPGPPVAAISAPASARTGVLVTFDGSGSWDPDGSIVSYDWVFDDGTTATGLTVSHAFATMGRHSATLTVTDNSGNASVPPATQSIDVIAPVIWTNQSGVLATGNDLVKTLATSAWDSGASSTQVILGDGYAEFTAQETNTGRAFGLNHEDLAADLADLDFAIQIGSGGVVSIYQSGVSLGTFGSYASGDRLRVAVESGVVKYYRNGSPLYTSTVAPTFPLHADTSFKYQNATVKDAVIWGLP